MVPEPTPTGGRPENRRKPMASPVDPHPGGNKPPRRRRQFSLAALLLAMTLLGVLGAVLAGMLHPRPGDDLRVIAAVAVAAAAPLVVTIVLAAVVAARRRRQSRDRNG